ncbi:MAG TPA: hypothetical protein DCZ10_16900 [Pelotomaculum sp.]|nr:hypothetical protein [Pelotomaculum sp.]
MAFTKAFTLSPFLNPASSKLSLVITDVSRKLLSPQSPTHMLTCAITLSVLISLISPLMLLRTPTSIKFTSPK